MPQTRQEAQEADRLDPLAPYRDEFVFSPGGPIYLDGNSLGRRPRATAAAVNALLDEWGQDLVSGWHRWAGMPATVGDRIGQLLGAAPGQVVVSDSTTVNLYKLAMAAVDARPDRPLIVGDAEDFPTVRYVLQGIAAHGGRRLQLVATDPVEGTAGSSLSGPTPGPVHDPLLDAIAASADGELALVCLSAVNYRSGAVVDMASVTGAVHRAGALTLWDLSHAAGAVPVDLDGAGADLAVGCSYKYLNGGPGAPAWVYVRSGLQASLRQPIWAGGANGTSSPWAPLTTPSLTSPGSRPAHRPFSAPLPSTAGSLPSWPPASRRCGPRPAASWPFWPGEPNNCSCPSAPASPARPTRTAGAATWPCRTPTPTTPPASS